MSAILSMLFIIFLYDSKLSKIILSSSVEQKDYYKVWLHYSIIQLFEVLINNSISYFLYKFLPDSFTAVLILCSLLISTGYYIVLNKIFKRYDITEYFNTKSLFYMLSISSILQLELNTSLLGTILTTVLNGIAFLIIGIILISVLNNTDKYRFGKLPYIMIISSIILMIITIM